MNRKYLAVFGLLFSLVFVTASTTRIASPLLIGLGNSGTKEIDFDSGNGANNAKLITTANTDLSLKVNGTTRVTANSTGVTTTGVNLGAGGLAGAPTYSFTSDATTGMYLPSSNVLGLAAGGATGLNVTATGPQLLNGSASVPSISFVNDTNTGFYSKAADVIAVAAGGQIAGQWSLANGTSLTGGSASTPALNFINSLTTGFYRAGADQLGVAVAGSNQATIDSNGLELVGRIEMNGDGSFKTKVFTSSTPLTSGSTASLSVSGSVLGAVGVFNVSGGVWGTIGVTVPGDPTGAGNPLKFRHNSGGIGEIQIINLDTSSHDWRAIVTYQ